MDTSPEGLADLSLLVALVAATAGHLVTEKIGVKNWGQVFHYHIHQ